MKTCFDLASVALFDLLVSAGERRTASDEARQQDEHDVEAEEGVEHGSVLIARAGLLEQQVDAVAEQASANQAQNEDEEVHRSVPVDVAVDFQEEPAGDASGDEGNEGDFEVEHLGRLLLLLCAQAPQLTVARLGKHDQLLAESESRFGSEALQEIADSCLATSTDRGDLHLAKAAFLNACDEL